MCGRYRRKSDKQRIAEAFSVSVGVEELYLEVDDDIAPGSIQPVVLTNKDGDRQLELMGWGFNLPDRFLFNARSEGIDKSDFWSDKFLNRRCIVPADTFFEWVKVQKGPKPKYEFAVPGREPFGMAGIWSPWKNPKTDQWEDTFAIVTGEANGVMRPVHDRQPTILEPKDYAEYLSVDDRAPVHLLRILPEEEMRATLVKKDEIPSQQASLFDSQ